MSEPAAGPPQPEDSGQPASSPPQAAPPGRSGPWPLPGVRLQGSVDLSAIEQFFADGIPFNRFLGLRLTGLGRGWARGELPFRPEFIGDPTRPALHGGVISMVADTIGGAAVFSLTDPGDKVATIDLRIDYLRPGQPELLVAHAWVIRSGNRVGVSTIELHHPSAPADLVALGKAVYTIRRAAD